MCRTSISCRVVLVGVALASTGCLLPPLWLTVDDSDAGAAGKSMTGGRDVAMGVLPVAAEDTALDASPPMMVSSASAAPAMPQSMPDASAATTNASDAGAAGMPCMTDAQCTAGLVCAARAPDSSGVCVDPHMPCLTVGDAAICDPQGMMYECGPDGTIGGHLQCDSPALCRAGLPIRHCRVASPRAISAASLFCCCARPMVRVGG